MARIIVREEEIEGEKRQPPRVSKILISEHTVGATKISMGTNVTEVGSRIPLHTHTDSEEAMFVIQGRGKLVADGKEYDLYPGTAIYSPLGVEHETGGRRIRAGSHRERKTGIIDTGMYHRRHNRRQHPAGSICRC